MRKGSYFLSFLMLPIFFSGSHLYPEELKPSEIIKKASLSVVEIAIYDRTGETFSGGSGFFIAPQLILTCAHVMEDAYSAEVISKTNHYRKVKILKMNETMDLALLMVDSENERPLQFEMKNKIAKGQRVLSLGYILLDLTADKIVLAKVSRYKQNLIVSHAIAYPGWSGGPLLNMDGNVVGVVTSSLETQPDISLAVGLETIQDFLKEPDKLKLLPEAGSKILWRFILKEFVEFCLEVYKWTRDLFFNGDWIRFICIVVLGIILVGLILKELFRVKREREIKKIKKIFMQFIEV